MSLQFPEILQNVLDALEFDLEFTLDLSAVCIPQEPVIPIGETSVGPYWWTWNNNNQANIPTWWKDPLNRQIKHSWLMFYYVTKFYNKYYSTIIFFIFQQLRLRLLWTPLVL